MSRSPGCAGPAGEFYNVTWPGYVGALTAMAPGRFGASINQAPMRRRGHSPKLRLFDLAANGLHTLLRVRSIPPDQLLRQVFEECRDFGEAKFMLERTAIARPVIYTLVGCAPGERCVIERTEDSANTRDHDTGSANNWFVPKPQWEGRVGSDKVLHSTFEEAAENSRARREALATGPGISPATVSAGSPRRCSTDSRASVSRCVRRAASCALSVMSNRTRMNCRSPPPRSVKCSRIGSRRRFRSTERDRFILHKAPRFAHSAGPPDGMLLDHGLTDVIAWPRKNSGRTAKWGGGTRVTQWLHWRCLRLVRH